MQTIMTIQSEKCYGCTACQEICPVSAIAMKKDIEGFFHPQLSEEQCIHCGQCLSVCPAAADGKSQTMPLAQMGMHQKNQEIHLSSQSGGVFYTVAKQFMINGGIVYGAVLKADYSVAHQEIHTVKELAALQGSKYVQSDLEHCVSKINMQLKEGRKVLFSGTPCQCAGVKNAVKKNAAAFENQLYLIDLICHGVPSPKLWKDYTEYLTHKYRGPIDKICFRDKEKPVNTHYESFEINGVKRYACTYAQLFYSHAFLRPSCENCAYRDTKRVGDLTVGDYIGVKNHHPELFQEKGESLVLINSEKGQELLKPVLEQFSYSAVALDECMQPPLGDALKVHPNRSKIWQQYETKGFASIARRYGHEPYWNRIRRRLKKLR